jgi:hypothetical protein
MADTTVNIEATPMTIGVTSGASGRLNGVIGETYDIYNIGESGITCYFNMRPFTWHESGGTKSAELLSSIATGVTGKRHLQVVAVGGSLTWRPDPDHPYIDVVVLTGTTVLSVSRR